MSIFSKINAVPLSRLCLISVCGGFASIGFVYFARNQVASKVEQEPFCKESLRMLRNHPGANHVFGKGFEVKVKIKMLGKETLALILANFFSGQPAES